MLNQAEHLHRLTVDDRDHLETAVEEFESAWENGRRPDLDDFLPADGPLRQALAVELALADLEYRLRAGEPASADDYLRRYPEVRTAEGELRSAESRWSSAPPTIDRSLNGEMPVVPGYQLLGELGRGGMGVVYKARQVAADRVVALKMTRTDGTAEPDLHARFRTEAEAAARLQHPNIVQIFEVGVAGGRPFFAMEYVDGGSLADRLTSGPVPPADAVDLLLSLARAIEAAHARGILHRDLKPANVLLRQAEESGLGTDGMTSSSLSSAVFRLSSSSPKVTDFGLAKRLDRNSDQTKTGAVLGTPSFMAPEQAAGPSRELTPAVDVYALGATLYACLTSRPPFQAATVLDTIEQVKSRDPVPPRLLQPTVPRDLETICLKCLRKEPARRYSSAAALVDELERFRDGKPILARPAGRLERGWKWVKRRPATAAAIAISTLALLAITSLSVGFTLRLKDERDLTALQRDRAETSYRLAREAMETGITKVRSDPRFQRGELEDVRRVMLKAEADFYERFVTLNAGDAAFLAERSDAFFRLGSVTTLLGSKNEAILHFRTAADIDRRLVHDRPDEVAPREHVAKVLVSLGLALRATGQNAAAESAFRESETQLDPLTRVEPVEPEVARLFGETLRGIAQIDLDRGNIAAAAATLQRADRFLKPIVDGQPSNNFIRLALARVYGDQAGASSRAKRLQEAEEYYLKSSQQFEALVRDQPGTATFRSDLGANHINLGRIFLQTNRFEMALQSFFRADEVFEQLVREHPAVTVYRQGLAGTRKRIGLAYRALHNTKECVAWSLKSIDILESIVREHPNVPEYSFDLGSSYFHQGLVLSESGAPDAAIAPLGRAIQVLEGVPPINPEDGPTRQPLYLALWERGLAHKKLGHYAAARPDYDRAITLGGPKVDAWLVWQRADVLAHLGDHAFAVAELKRSVAGRKLQGHEYVSTARIAAVCCAATAADESLSVFERDLFSEDYAVRAVQWLVSAKEIGFFNDAAHVKDANTDPDLQPLRNRDDFRKLLP
jgi:serine/threonine protein kinase/tetratricopeptide (TPR) repeat protein